MKLLVRNLARQTTEIEMRKLFEEFGEVGECTLVLDQETGQSKGFGFVYMPDLDQAKTAMFALNGKEIDKSKIKVKVAS
ncbi:RNA recognition motif domain-containing protein [Vibrio rumoiensis]|uniref:RNA recognition motif domain-containing protein n=1 Tax=Vibrio rumoiensis TaxID=76258 RepID=A0ABW7IYC6_9VIBR|nr:MULTISPECIES: RNA recognition motif containing protein [Vibrio]